MKQQVWISCLLTLPLISACGTGDSSDVKQQTIVQTYNVDYHESENRLAADASFHYDNALGTSLRLTENSRVQFAGTEMEYENVLDSARYIATQYGVPADRRPVFTYTNNDGQIFDVVAPVPPATGLAIQGSRIYQGSDLYFSVWGPELEEREVIEVCLLAAEKRECATSRNHRVHFTRDQIARLPKGQVEAKLVRSRLESHKEPDIRLRTAFLARPLHFTVE